MYVYNYNVHRRKFPHKSGANTASAEREFITGARADPQRGSGAKPICRRHEAVPGRAVEVEICRCSYVIHGHDRISILCGNVDYYVIVK